MTPSLKPLLLALAIVVMVVVAGCTSNSAYKEAMNNKIVSCSHFHKITDDYITPEGRYVVLEGYSGKYLAEDVDLDLPGNITGKYVSCGNFEGCVLWNLTPLSENETGMRDACRVEPS